MQMKQYIRSNKTGIIILFVLMIILIVVIRWRISFVSHDISNAHLYENFGDVTWIDKSEKKIGIVATTGFWNDTGYGTVIGQEYILDCQIMDNEEYDTVIKQLKIGDNIGFYAGYGEIILENIIEVNKIVVDNSKL